MKKARLLVLGLAALVALALASPALAVRTFTVSPAVLTVGGSGDFTVAFAQDDADAPLAKVTIYAPSGYSSLLSQAVGARIGIAKATVILKALAGAKVPDVPGEVTVGNPATYTSGTPQASAIACTGTATHEAFWVLTLTLAGTPVPVTVYVDRVTAGPETAFASLKLQVCFSSPDVPQDKGGAPTGAQPVSAQFTMTGVVTNPATAGTYTWRAIFTPYQPGTSTVNAAGSVEGRSLVQLPTQLTLSGKRIKKKVGKKTFTFARLGGTLTRVGVGVSGANVEILANGKRVTTVRTRARGVFSVDIRVRATTTYTVRAVLGVQRIDAEGCAGQAVTPARCESATAAPATVKSAAGIRIRP
jgi:hypothetical protein